MKGIVLAGGMGTRLGELTKVLNKHLLPVYDKPMIYYPIETLKKAGIVDIMIIMGGKNLGEFANLLRDGRDLGVSLTYRVQDKPNGIGGALALAKDFVGEDSCMVCLGDNILEDDLGLHVRDFKSGAQILVKAVHDPERFGVAEVEDGKIVSIAEKPSAPASNLAVIGVYVYDKKVFDLLEKISPSDRGELEITDVNNAYVALGEMRHSEVQGFWYDAGNPTSLFRASKAIFEANPHGNSLGKAK